MSAESKRQFSAGWRLGLAGLCVSVVILLILFVLEPTRTTQSQGPKAPPTELIGPRPLDESSGTAGGISDPNLSVSLPQGGWLQVAGADGQLSQQYRFSHLNPDPPELPQNWIQMQNPEVELFMRGGRLVTLSGNEADAYAPRQALEEGRLIGNVVIRMYEPVNGAHADPSRTDAAMTIRTTAAEFDNLSGRITCDGRIEADTLTESLRGRDLQLLLNDRDDRIEYLEIASVDYLLLRDVQALRSARRGAPHQYARQASPHRPHIMQVAKQQVAPVFYRLIMHKDVRIEQTPPAGSKNLPRIATADDMHVVFSLESGAFEDTPPATALRTTAPTLAWIASAAIGAPPLPPSHEEVLITCKGPLTMVPLEKDAEIPPTADDIRLELRGENVHINDPEQNLDARCAMLTYRSETERFDLTATTPRGVVLTSKDLRIENAHTWVRPDAGIGAVEGSGEASLSEISKTDSSGIDTTTITWQRRVDLAFDPSRPDAEGGLRTTRFLDQVSVQSPDGTIDGEDLEMHFAPDESGKAVPDRFIGRGGIRASSDEQILWADELRATLGPSTSVQTDGIEVQNVHAKGNVQVLLADGARAWADQLHGDAAQEEVELIGSEVLILRDEVLIGEGTTLQIKRREGVADWPGAGRAMMFAMPPASTPDARMDRPVLPMDRAAEDNEITWQESVHIEFDPEADNQDVAMRSIEFIGSVTIDSPDGQMQSTELQMDFTKDDQGRSEPHLLTCRGRVRAHSDGQTIWADDLVATLEAKDDTSDSRIDIREVIAIGDVQVLMKDGGRAFSDRLDGDAAQETVILTGEDVLIARGDMLMDRGQHLQVDRLKGTADWTGSGRSRLLAEPLDMSADHRLPLPRVVGGPGDPRVLMRTLWTTSLHYDSRFRDGAGAMDLDGNVDAVVDQSDQQRSRLQGDSIRLEFMRVEGEPKIESANEDDPFGPSGRVLDRLIARGEARLESRIWEDASRESIPQVFFVGAKHLTWHDITSEAEVIGDGQLVIREPDWTSRESKRSGPFSGPGTSRFTWEERLDLVRQADDRYRMTMRGDVEGMWASTVDHDDVATITADEVDVLSRRGDDTQVAEDTPMRLGGDMEVDRLQAVGRVLLSTPTRTADCHMLDYNTRTNIAEMVARAGRTVSMLTEGASMPVHATRMIWNMDPAIDTITLQNPRGTGDR